MFKKIFMTVLLAFMSIPAVAQQFQTSDLPPITPLYLTNAKYVNGWSPGYAPTGNSTGLTLMLSSGTNFVTNAIVNYAGGTLSLTDASTNYVYLDNTGTPAFNTSGFIAGESPIAIVVTSGGNISSITDVRGFFFNAGASGGVTSVTFTGDGIVDSNTPSTPVTSTGTVTATILTQSANKILAGPATGSASNPSFRSMVIADLPTAIPNANLANPSTSVNGQTCTLGSSCTVSASGSGYSSVNNQTANYTTVLGDAGGYVRVNNASANTVTIPLNASVAYTIGTTITIIQVGAGQTTIVATSGVTINTPTSLAARAQWSTIMVTKVATDTWDAAGDLQ